MKARAEEEQEPSTNHFPPGWVLHPPPAPPPPPPPVVAPAKAKVESPISPVQVEKASDLPRELVLLMPHCYVKGCTNRADRYISPLKPLLWIKCCTTHRMFGRQTTDVLECFVCQGANSSRTVFHMKGPDAAPLRVCSVCVDGFEQVLEYFHFLVGTKLSDEEVEALSRHRENGRPRPPPSPSSSSDSGSEEQRPQPKKKRLAPPATRNNSHAYEPVLLPLPHTVRPLDAVPGLDGSVSVELPSPSAPSANAQKAEVLAEQAGFLMMQEQENRLDHNNVDFALSVWWDEDRGRLTEALLRLGRQGVPERTWVLDIFRRRKQAQK